MGEGEANQINSVDRRRFLVKAGATAAVAGGLWAAPEILSPTRAFAGTSCVLRASTLVGTTGYWGQPGLTWGQSGSFPAVTLTSAVTGFGTFTPTAGSGNGGIATPPVAVQGLGVPTQRVFYFDQSAANGGGQQVVFTFTVPVYNVTFRVYDIDRNLTADGNGQNYRDSVNVQAAGGATVSGSSPGGAPSGNGTTGTPFLGTTVGNTSTNASYGDYTLNGAVTSFTLRYNNDIPSGNGTRMIIGIGDISFCR